MYKILENNISKGKIIHIRCNMSVGQKIDDWISVGKQVPPRKMLDNA